MKISSFTQAELDLLREECNFTDIESHCFEAKARDKTDVQLAIEMCVSESTIAVIMRRVRSKITAVLRNNTVRSNTLPDNSCSKCCPTPIYHTMEEWARIPDFMSTRGATYIYGDYRTEVVNGVEVNIPRVKYGDGVHSISALPFATVAATDKDVEYWDGRTEFDGNDYKDIIIIGKEYKGDNKFTFPFDGYLMLKFDNELAYATVNICSRSGKSYFIFEKRRNIDIHSKEVFVRKGMQCEYIDCSGGAEIRFIPLV